MRRTTALILAVLLLFSFAQAEEQKTQKAPDFIMEGYDGDLNYRNWDTNLFFERMQEKTGIGFQFRQYRDFTEWTRRKAELLRGEDLPDVLFKAELEAGEVRDLYEAGYIIDLAPLMEQYAPNLWKLLEDHPEWKKAVSMADGAVPALPGINMLQNNDAMWINSDWLRRTEKEMPSTAEELTEVLRAFKTKDPNNNYQQDEVPLTFIGMWELRFLGHAFGLIDNDFYVRVEDGKVVSSLATEENRAFLTWLHELWQEGLIDHSGFANTDSMRQVTDDKKPNVYGMILSSTPLTVVTQSHLGEYSLLEPLSWQGKQVYRDLLGDLIRGTFAITSSCKEPERLLAWVDNLYTEEGSNLAHYGLEGDDYIWDEDGWWEWNADLETTGNEILPEHTLSEGGATPGITDVRFQLKYRDETTRKSVEQLNALKQYSVFPFPYITLSREDESRIAELQRGLSAYAEKTMACFVTGDLELTDANWDQFCASVQEKGLTEMMGIWQKYVQ